MEIVKVNNIHYKVHSKTILEDISFSVNEQESVALIGANGSGKTTLIDIILGDLRPTSGSIELFGTGQFNFNNVGVVYDRLPLFPMLKVGEVIKYFCYLNRVNYKELIGKGYIELFQLEKFSNSLIGHLSQGEKQRVGVLLSIIRNPKLLILDEPFSNLDPIIINRIWSVIKTEQRTVLFSTHNWKEVEKLATKIVLIHNGKMMCNPTSPKELLNQLPANKKLVVQKSEQLVNVYNNHSCYLEGENLILFYDGNPQIIDTLSCHTSNYTIQDVSLKDVYLYSLKN